MNQTALSGSPDTAKADEHKPWYRRGLGWLIPLALLATKAKGIALFVAKLKFATTSLSMVVSIGAYALIWGWWFALGFVVMLFVHEYGHVIQLRREGIKASAPMFIPFLGAVIAMKELPKDALAEARVGLAGPILGSLAAVACLPVYWATGDELFKALAYTGFFLNLFNLFPMLPLDGGRAMAAVSPKIWLVGLAALIPLLVITLNPVLLLIAIFGIIEGVSRWKAHRRGDEDAVSYHKVSPRNRLIVLGVYVGLALALGYGMHETFMDRSIGDY